MKISNRVSFELLFSSIFVFYQNNNLLNLTLFVSHALRTKRIDFFPKPRVVGCASSVVRQLIELNQKISGVSKAIFYRQKTPKIHTTRFNANKIRATLVDTHTRNMVAIKMCGYYFPIKLRGCNMLIVFFSCPQKIFAIWL